MLNSPGARRRFWFAVSLTAAAICAGGEVRQGLAQPAPLGASVPVPRRVPSPNGAQAPGTTASGAQTTDSAPAAEPPFQLSREEQAVVDQVLLQWERESAKIQTFRCGFERWEYDPVFLQGGDKIPVSKCLGHIRYAKPDKGLYRITETRRYDNSKQDWLPSDEPGEHWVCDGQAVYEFSTAKKQLIVRELPSEMQGKAIADGPLPFLFNAEAEKLKQRYWLRVTETTNEEIWIEAWPRFRNDAANFQRVDLILERERFLPSAIQIYLPNGKNRTVYMFQTDGAKVNDPVERVISFFQQPRTPLGWQRVVEPAPARQAARDGHAAGGSR